MVLQSPGCQIGLPDLDINSSGKYFFFSLSNLEVGFHEWRTSIDSILVFCKPYKSSSFLFLFYY